MEALSPWHIVVVAVVAGVLFFGWRQPPDMSRSLGRSLRIFKSEINGLREESATAAREAAEAVTAELRPQPSSAPPTAPNASPSSQTPSRPSSIATD
jgi:sec-independent protein translocase protein TatA